MSENTAGDAAPGRQAKRGQGIDLKVMTAGDLRQLIADAETELRAKQEEAKAALRAKWQAEAAEAGLSLDVVMTAGAAPGQGRKARKDGGAKRPAKYRNPEGGETWSGVGRLPKWLDAYEKAGRNREEFRVN